MVKAIFFFFLVVCIIAAAISDWRIRRLDGRPIKEKSGIETIAIDKSDPLTGSASVDITAKLEIIASSPSSADEPYFLGAPWNLNKRPIKEKNAAPIVRKLGSKFYCKALIFKNKNAFTAIVNVDLPAINAAGRKAALASLQAAGYSTAAVMIITPGFINLPISISPTDFAAAVVAAVKQADAASGRSDYAFVNSPDTILRTEKSRISIPDCGAVDLPSALFSQVPDSGKNDDATSIINRWYSIVLKDTSLYPRGTFKLTDSKPAITSALIFRKQDGKNSGCIVFTNIRPVILSADNAITTDIAGIIVQQLEKKLECPVIFHTMPACDVSLKIETADLASTKRVGTRIAQQLLSEIKRARYSKLEKAYAYSLKTDMPMKAECKLPVSTLSEKAERYSEQIKELKNIDLDIPDKGELLNRTIRYASFALRNDSAGNNEIPLIMGLRLDTMSIFYLPGATTISTADSLTRLMPQTILLASGLNGMHDAILPDEAFDEGGWWASVSSYTKGAEKELLKSMNSLVASTFPRIFKKRLLKAE